MESVSCAFDPLLSLANKYCCAVPLQAVHCSPVLWFYHFFSFLPIKTFIFLCCYAWTLQGPAFLVQNMEVLRKPFFLTLWCVSLHFAFQWVTVAAVETEKADVVFDKQSAGKHRPINNLMKETNKQRNKGGRKQGKTNKQRMMKIQMDDLANVLNKWWRVSGEIVSIRKFVSWTALPYFQ